MTTDTNKPAPVAEPASEDCIDTALSTMQTALRAAWEGDYTKSARYVELTATRLEARDQHNPAKWLRIALEEMQGKRQPVAVHAMSVPAPAVDERIADSDSVDLAAASNGSPGGATYVDERGELRRERRRRPRDDDDERIEHLFVGFDNVIANADDYTRGYVRAMRQEFGQLIASLVR